MKVGKTQRGVGEVEGKVGIEKVYNIGLTRKVLREDLVRLRRVRTGILTNFPTGVRLKSPWVLTVGEGRDGRREKYSRETGDGVPEASRGGIDLPRVDGGLRVVTTDWQEVQSLSRLRVMGLPVQSIVERARESFDLR